MLQNDLSVVFPGQGSQSVGMLAAIENQFSEVRQTFSEASDVLGYDLLHLTQEGPKEELDKTYHTQPALLAASYSLWRIINSNEGIKPAFLAGHSLGEYTALVCAGALNYKDAIKLVAARGKFMQEAIVEGEGAMAAIIGLDEPTVEQICKVSRNAEEVLAPANFNSIGQVVIAGHKNAVLKAMALAKEQGAKLTVLIPVSVPSHCALMKPAALQLEKLLINTEINPPKIPVVNNVDVKIYDTPDSIRSGLSRQLYMPVRWVETIQYLVRNGIKRIIECGPGNVLTGLNKRIHKELQLITSSTLATLESERSL